jgi:hypothetical protein
MMSLILPYYTTYSVVFVGTGSADQPETHALRGTAFFVGVPSEAVEGFASIYLVTARHVANRLEGPSLMRANTIDGTSAVFDLTGARWHFHPDPKVDVAAYPWAPPFNVLHRHVSTKQFYLGKEWERHTAGIGNEVFAVGLFAKLVGSRKNLPIVRMGSIAMMPDEAVPTELAEVEAYLVEMRSVGGLSGSPVFVRYQWYQSWVIKLIGVMHGHWDIPPQSDGESVQYPNRLNRTMNMGVAIVTPAVKVIELLDVRELAEHRAEHERQFLAGVRSGPSNWVQIIEEAPPQVTP